MYGFLVTKIKAHVVGRRVFVRNAVFVIRYLHSCLLVTINESNVPAFFFSTEKRKGNTYTQNKSQRRRRRPVFWGPFLKSPENFSGKVSGLSRNGTQGVGFVCGCPGFKPLGPVSRKFRNFTGHFRVSQRFVIQERRGFKSSNFTFLLVSLKTC